MTENLEKKEFFVIEEAVFVKKKRLAQPEEGRLSAITDDDDIEGKVATTRRRSATV
jgi:hypothetical protein